MISEMNTRVLKKRVPEIFFKTLRKENEEGIQVFNVSLFAIFSPSKLKHYKKEVKEMLNELPEKFKSDSGDMLCHAVFNKYGKRWTHSRDEAEMLLQLGMAVEKVECLVKRRDGRSRYKILI